MTFCKQNGQDIIKERGKEYEVYGEKRKDFVCVVLAVLIIYTFVSMFVEYNHGVCPTCGVKYELSAVGEDFMKYFTCPKCKNVVKYIFQALTNNRKYAIIKKS